MVKFLARSFASGYTFLEGPRWHQGHLWVSDFFTRRVLKFDLQGNAEVMAVVDGMPSGLGFMPDGTPLVVSQMTHHIFRIRSRSSVNCVHSILDSPEFTSNTSAHYCSAR